MRTQKIRFPDDHALCVFPDKRSNLGQAMSALQLEDSYPVIVLIGGDIDEQHAEITAQVIQILSRIAEEKNAVVICGGTDMGVMAEIGRLHAQKRYTFPLLGITPEELVTWPGGPYSKSFMGLGNKRLQLEPHYTHFILVPGNKFGDESPWIVDAAALLSNGHRSVTILINGGNISRQDIELSVEHGRPVIALEGTGRLADELAAEQDRHNLISVVPANAGAQVNEVVRAAISDIERSEYPEPVSSEFLSSRLGAL